MRSPVRVLALVGVLAAVTLAAVVLRGSFDMPLRGRQGDDPSQARRGRPLGSSAGPATLVDPDSGEEAGPGRVDHSTFGAKHAATNLPGHAGQVLAFCIAGHHAGLADKVNR